MLIAPIFFTLSLCHDLHTSSRKVSVPKQSFRIRFPLLPNTETSMYENL